MKSLCRDENRLNVVNPSLRFCRVFEPWSHVIIQLICWKTLRRYQNVYPASVFCEYGSKNMVVKSLSDYHISTGPKSQKKIFEMAIPSHCVIRVFFLCMKFSVNQGSFHKRRQWCRECFFPDKNDYFFMTNFGNRIKFMNRRWPCIARTGERRITF